MPNHTAPDNPKSDRIYYTDSYAQAFSARVISLAGGYPSPGVILETTAFYPESGGQPSDRGTLGRLKIIEVIDTDSGIVHVVEGPPPEVGEEVQGRIDWDRRFDHMQQHTGQHVLSQAFIEVLETPTIGFHMGESVSTIDLDVDSVAPEEISRVEALANRVVFENRPITVRFADSSEQESLGLRKPSERSGLLRIVEIADFDCSACGGTHCNQTGEVGLIKVRRQERVRQKARIEFVCGYRALADYQSKTDLLAASSQLLSIGEADLPAAIERQLEQHKTLRKDLSRAQDKLLEFQAARAVEDAEQGRGYEVVSGVWDGLDMGQLNRLAGMILQDAAARIAILGGRGAQSYLLFGRSRDLSQIDLRPVMARAAALAGGRGGGSPDRCQAGACNAESLNDAIETARNAVRDGGGQGED